MANDRSPAALTSPTPLAVDLDGTLLRSDLLAESIFALLGKNVLYLLALPVWLARGKAALKREVARRVELDAARLPYNEELLAYLREQHAAGRPLVLATASNESLALQVAEHVGLFQRVFASDATCNLSAQRKRDVLVRAYGRAQFDYAGNSGADLTVWQAAREAILVAPSARLRRAAERIGNVGRVFADHGQDWRAQLLALRPHQWLKNLLVFAPFVAAQTLDEPRLWASATIAFISFCLCASSVYLMNDLLDLASDRVHPLKRNRPIAAGAVPVVRSAAAVPLLLLAALALAASVSMLLVAVLIVYYASSAAYSLGLKRVLMLDVVVLAGLYTLRLLAGSAAIAVPPSAWFLAFSMFLFLSLAFVKRYSELFATRSSGRRHAPGRGYEVDDLSMLAALGASSGFVAVLVLALYVNSTKITQMYERPELIWLLCPLLMYWIGRLWLLACRGRVHEDPLLFAVTDRASGLTAVAGLLVLLAAN